MKIQLLLLGLAMVCFSGTLLAQDAPESELFVGVSGISNGEFSAAYGWQASAAYNMTPNIGLVADFGGQYKDSVDQHEFLFGPRYNVRREKATPFVHALFGYTRAHADNFTNTKFAMGLGGGLDVNAGARLKIRLFQAEWIPIKTAGEWSFDVFRVGVGVVFPFGQ